MNLWDEKAPFYARFNENLSPLQKEVFKELESLNIDFKDKSVLDIGCGTGVWSIHLARKTRHLSALDSSKAMLEILQNDSQNARNISPLHASFKDFASTNQQKFDIAFLSMSASLQDLSDFEAFLSLAKDKIYLNWAKPRQSSLMSFVLSALNARKEAKNGFDLEDFLRQKNISFHKKIFNETRRVQRSRNEALENAAWHLKMANIAFNQKELESLITQDFMDEIKASMKLLVVKE